MPGISSAEVQATFLPYALELGFTSEAKGLFLEYENKLRPDYYRAVGKSGVLLEVERGKTTTNNMDLLDMWKCHLCRHADFLFLMVPQALKHNHRMTPKREYSAVVKRLGTFSWTPMPPMCVPSTSSAINAHVVLSTTTTVLPTGTGA
ncbi:hypothetical protein [Nocardioides houyundeii]|uniref:hypothetical protein n=1 Tax=Nocardioides houyundeii TaxID=2045452 RepID=UPI000C767C00|nr:hypothetical protein [Nocardioides houyundeii]